MAMFERISAGPSRATDRWGSGQFGAFRTGHKHQGLDVGAPPGAQICAPIEGQVIRESIPYKGDSHFRGIVINGSGSWSGYEVKLFYVNGIICGQVNAGQVVGFAQDLSTRYPGITNHVHMEVRKNGMLLSPADMY